MTKADPRFHACIIAGGSGERFWPMSRASAPKHLLRLFSERTLLEDTILRLKGVVADGNIWILTNASQVPLIRKALPAFPRGQIIAEPAKRDTAPAAALATGLVRARDPHGIVALLPADALIKNKGRFGEQLTQVFKWAAGEGKGHFGQNLFTFAIAPTYPATGFGYLELGAPLATGREGSRLLRVKRFVEKPDAATARGYLRSKRFAWNAGMFVWGVGRFLHEVEKNAPELAAFVRDFPAGNPARYLAKRFHALPKISVDYAVLEKAASVATVFAEFDWDDVGAWTALPTHHSADASGNVSRGAVVSVGTTNTIAVSNGRVIALCGLKDLVVVETHDAVLVCHRDAVQDIKKLLPLLPLANI
jgi:mannose-1-phosphate guanylyltransferase